MHLFLKQISYGSFDPILSDKRQFPFFFSMVPNENVQYEGIIHLLKHFGWNWIGLIASDDESGEIFLQNIQPKLFQNDICIAWMQSIRLLRDRALNMHVLSAHISYIKETILVKKISVFLASGTVQSMEALQCALYLSEKSNKNSVYHRVWIVTSQWDFTVMTIAIKSFPTQTFNGSLYFSLHTNTVPRFQEFLGNISSYLHSSFYIDWFWESVFSCSFPPYPKKAKHCTGKEELARAPDSVFEMTMSGESYNIYNGVSSVAHALQTMHSSREKTNSLRNRNKLAKFSNFQPWEVCHHSSQIYLYKEVNRKGMRNIKVPDLFICSNK
uniref:Receptor ligand binding region domain-containing protein n=1 Tax=Laticauda laticaudata TaxID=8630 RepID=A0A8C5SLQ4_LATLA